MTQKSRKNLKELFSKGRLPSEQDFSDLVDSSINPMDDGFDITREDGIKVRPTERGQLLSVFTDPNDFGDSQWRLGLDADRKFLNLDIKTEPEEQEDLPDQVAPEPRADFTPLLTISSHKKRIGVNTPDPKHTLEVKGIVAATGRVGAFKTGSVKANGKWKTIVANLEGCQMFEVIAGVAGERKLGQYALLNAIAMNCYNPKSWFPFFKQRSKIKHHHAFFDSPWDRIHLRWVNEKNGLYSLQIKTIRNFCRKGGNYQITYSITQLWFDPHMLGSTLQSEEESS